MSVTRQRPPGVGPPNERDTTPWVPGRPLWQQFLIGAVGVLLVVGAILLAVRFWAIPALQSRGADPGIAGEATLAALQTQQALTPRTAATSAVAPAVQPTVAATAARTPAVTTVPTPVPAVAPTLAPTPQPTPLTIPIPAAQPTTAPSSAPATAGVGTSVPAANGTPNSLPTPSPEMVTSVSEAYLQFWSVYTYAFLNLDPAPLDQVAAGDELAVLQHDIEANHSQGRALKTDVQHQFAVIVAINDQAVVTDDIRDSSIYVDPETEEPLPGQAVTGSPDKASEYKGVYRLQLINNTWKVVEGTGE
jgi:hypothetical protein